MLKRTITYNNFDNEEVTEEICFHLSKAELIQMEVEIPEGLEEHFKMVSESQDGKLIIKTMKDLILRSYGIRDGNRFRKNAQIREDFESSEAFSELFMELATNGESAANFVVGIMPANLDADIAKITAPASVEVEELSDQVVPIRTITRVEATNMTHGELMDHISKGGLVEN